MLLKFQKKCSFYITTLERRILLKRNKVPIPQEITNKRSCKTSKIAFFPGCDRGVQFDELDRSVKI